MDDLNEKIARLLSSPDSLQKIQSAMAAFGGTPAEPAAAPPPSPTPSPAPSSGLPDLAALAKLAPLLGSLGQDNDDTRLLQALRPYLHGEREQRLDDTMRLLRLTRLLPLLQEQGILSGMLTGGDRQGGGGGHGG